MKPVFFPYKMSSQSCKLLARELRAMRVYPDRHFTPKQRHLLINWGNSNHANWNIHRTGHVLNKPQAVSKASNKLSTLRSLQSAGVGIPRFSTSRRAVDFGSFDYPIYCRTTLTGCGGCGIIVANNEDELVDAPLYTQGVGHEREFRVHVFNDRVIDFTEKKKRRGVEHNNLIRNFKGGWVFCREGIELPSVIREQSIMAVQALGLDFGAVDIGLKGEESFVFEVNTAPGIEGTSVQAYAQAIRRIL